uniref:Ig-like domain-containing protein n=1 Tax=Myripristis murdjan TaxID=586833 RepID=A0A668A4I9_9TELE
MRMLLTFILWIFSHGPLVLKKTVHTGDSVTLECQAGSAAEITAAEWRKTDQKKQEEPVFLSVDGHFKSDVQHPSFKNQVEPRDGEMKSDDLSVILKNVKKEDSGTYECRFKAAGEDRRKRAIIGKEPICTIRLEVVDPGELSQYRTTSELSLTQVYSMLAGYEETEDGNVIQSLCSISSFIKLSCINYSRCSIGL